MADETPSAPPLAKSIRLPRDQLRICAAEDNKINQKILAKLLEKGLGCPELTFYGNGQEAVDGIKQRAAEGTPFHIVFMDVSMPVLGGLQASVILREDENDKVRDVLLIGMHASIITGNVQNMLKHGMDDCISKPLQQSGLEAILEKYVQSEA